MNKVIDCDLLSILDRVHRVKQINSRVRSAILAMLAIPGNRLYFGTLTFNDDILCKINSGFFNPKVYYKKNLFFDILTILNEDIGGNTGRYHFHFLSSISDISSFSARLEVLQPSIGFYSFRCLDLNYDDIWYNVLNNPLHLSGILLSDNLEITKVARYITKVSNHTSKSGLRVWTFNVCSTLRNNHNIRYSAKMLNPFSRLNRFSKRGGRFD